LDWLVYKKKVNDDDDDDDGVNLCERSERRNFGSACGVEWEFFYWRYEEPFDKNGLYFTIPRVVMRVRYGTVQTYEAQLRSNEFPVLPCLHTNSMNI
jgi:hypothetical protein